MYEVMIRYADGGRSKTGHHVDDLGEACAFVLRLADKLGGDAHDPANPPKWVEIFRGDRLEISVSVVGGGLVRRPYRPEGGGA